MPRSNKESLLIEALGASFFHAIIGRLARTNKLSKQNHLHPLAALQKQKRKKCTTHGGESKVLKFHIGHFNENRPFYGPI